MNKIKIYTDYLSKIETALNDNNTEALDYILEFIFTNQIPDDEMEAMDDILNEATLYTELWEQEYKDEALVLINEFK